MELVFGLFMIVVGLVIYFLPTVIANSRRNPKSNAIFLVNLLTGWTMLGWIAVLIWAFIDVRDAG